jgi:hypothetical protein
MFAYVLLHFCMLAAGSLGPGFVDKRRNALKNGNEDPTEEEMGRSAR